MPLINGSHFENITFISLDFNFNFRDVAEAFDGRKILTISMSFATAQGQYSDAGVFLLAEKWGMC